MGSYNDQNAFLGKLMKSQVVKRRRKPLETAEKFCRHCVAYSVLHGTSEISVCKKTFLSISDAGEKCAKNYSEKQMNIFAL